MRHGVGCDVGMAFHFPGLLGSVVEWAPDLGRGAWWLRALGLLTNKSMKLKGRHFSLSGGILLSCIL